MSFRFFVDARRIGYEGYPRGQVLPFLDSDVDSFGFLSLEVSKFFGFL
jgi:hypothetical protein